MSSAQTQPSNMMNLQICGLILFLNSFYGVGKVTSSMSACIIPF